MKIASTLASFSLADADLLRRAMGKKKASEMIKQKKKLRYHFSSLYKKDDLKLSLEHYHEDAIYLSLVYLAKKYGLKIKEIPVFYRKRTYGKSKTSLFKMFFIYLWIALNFRIGKTNN